MNDIERYNFWHLETEKPKEEKKKKDSKTKDFTVEDREFLQRIETFHHIDIDNRHDF